MKTTVVKRENSLEDFNFDHEARQHVSTTGLTVLTRIRRPANGSATMRSEETQRTSKERNDKAIRMAGYITRGHDRSADSSHDQLKSRISMTPDRQKLDSRQVSNQPYKRQKFRRRATSAATLRQLRDAFLVYLALMSLSLKCAVLLCDAFSIRDVIRVSGKRTTALDVVICPTWHPFQCPNGECIPIKYLCDGSPDCSDEYDEDKRMCTAAVRPPVEETAAFLKALLSAHGSDFLAKLFGDKAKDAMRAMGGVERVAVAISQSPTIDTFGAEMGLGANEVAQLATLLDAIVASETSELTPDEAGDFRFFVQKLQETGFF